MNYPSDVKNKSSRNMELEKIVEIYQKRPLTREELTLFVEGEIKKDIDPILDICKKFQNFKEKWLT